MPTVTIGSNTYDVYADLPTAQAYLAAQLTAITWNDPNTTPDQQSAALVSMTRVLDRQKWQGEQTDGYETHAWPRSGLIYADGTDVDPTIVPDALVNACMEGAAQLLDGSTLEDVSTTQNITRSLKAGSVQIEYFREIDGSPRFPQVIMELIGLWLGGMSAIPFGAQAKGTDGKTAFRDTYDVKQGF